MGNVGFLLSMLSLAVRPAAIEAQIVPISQSRFVSASVFGVTTNYAATGFENFSQNVAISSNDAVSGFSGSAAASQGSQISSSSVQGGGSAQAGGNAAAGAGAASSCSVTFQISSNLVYALSGSLDRNVGPGNGSGAPFFTLSGPTGTIFYLRYGYFSFGTNFSQTGYLSPGQYTVTGSANAAGGSGGGNESFSFNFGVSPPPPFAITAIAQQSSDVLLTWTAFPGTTNIVQATSGAGDGSYSNSFSDISPSIVISGSNGTTNYLDLGAATNFPARYYRVRLVP